MPLIICAHLPQIDLPADLRYVRVRFNGISSSFIYPTCCVVRELAHCFAKSTKQYARLTQVAIQLLSSIPGVISTFNTTEGAKVKGVGKAMAEGGQFPTS